MPHGPSYSLLPFSTNHNFTFMPLFSKLSFHSLSLLIRSSSVFSYHIQVICIQQQCTKWNYIEWNLFRGELIITSVYAYSEGLRITEDGVRLWQQCRFVTALCGWSDFVWFNASNIMYVGCVIYAEVPTLYQACLRVLMDNVDGKLFYLHFADK